MNKNMNSKSINSAEFYNLYNQEYFVMDFTKDENTINMSIRVTPSNYLEELENYSPDNRDNIIIVKDKEDKEDKPNYTYIFSGDKNNLKKEFPVLFDGSDRTYPSYIHFLPQRVFLGSIKTISDSFLKDMNINIIINMTLRKLNKNIISKEYHFPIDDDEDVDLRQILSQTYKILDSNTNILVVCEKGQSRSVSVVLDYYSKKYNIEKYQALEKFRQCRPICRPNKGFMKQIGI